MSKNLKNDDGVIERLVNEDLKTMTRVLENASKEEVPIEVDGMVYLIPKPISDLIDHLAIQAGIDNPKVNET
tara:strand:- start:390 stop:605 length:216 start_codon:yes stop_codon:yes gene_type:complete